MSEKATSAMHVIKKEDKQSVLRAFIAQDLEARRKDPACPGSDTSFCVIARTPDSPVARALNDMKDEISALGIPVHAVFASLGSKGLETTVQDGTLEINSTRVIQDARLLDVHEVLILDQASAWIGDCMRRDPAQNDAYERFSSDCTFTNTTARSAFEQLWEGARPVKSAWLSQSNRAALAIVSDQQLIATSASVSPVEDITPRVPSTRH